MYFCRLLSIFFLAFFSTLSWSFGDTLSMSSGYDAPPNKGSMDILLFKMAPFKQDSSIVKDLTHSNPMHSYPLTLKVAGVPVKAKQEEFASGEQVLSVDLDKVSWLEAISEPDSSAFEQLLFALSRNTKAASFHFFSQTRIIEIVTNQGPRIQTWLEEKTFIRRDLPEPLNDAVANQLLLAINCALNTDELTGHSTQCYGGALEKLGNSHVFFEASTHHTFASQEWLVQANTSELLELNLNSTTQLTLILDENGAIAKGDMVSFGEPSDMTEEDEQKNRKKDEGKENGSREDNGDSDTDNSPPPPSGSPPPGKSGDDGRDEDKSDRNKGPNSNEDEEGEDEDEERDDEEYDPLIDGFVEEQGDYEQHVIQHKIHRKKLGRAKHYHTPRDRSVHQRRKLKKKTGSVTEPAGSRGIIRPVKRRRDTVRLSVL